MHVFSLGCEKVFRTVLLMPVGNDQDLNDFMHSVGIIFKFAVSLVYEQDERV
jgi:hypothetical protein